MTHERDALQTRHLDSPSGSNIGAWGAPTRASRGSDEGTLNLVGQVIAERYRVLAPLSRGGMGAIYRAEHVTIGRPLALKVLRPKFSKNSKVMRRFLQEAQVTSQIRQENIIDIIDFGETPDGLAYLAMELLEGEDLLQTLKRDGPLPWARLGPMVLQICAALDAAHELGVIHRDMKPANCFRIQHAGNPDFIKVLDFGVAKLLYGDGQDKPITTAGTVVGTPLYLPPEVVSGATPTPQFDVYALGITMYQLLTGRRPFRGKVSLELLKTAAFNDPIPPSQVSRHVRVAPEVEGVILQAIQRDPAKRYHSAQALATAVMATLSQQDAPGAWATPYTRAAAATRRPPPPAASAASGAWTQPSNPSSSGAMNVRSTPLPRALKDADADEDAVTLISSSSMRAAVVKAVAAASDSTSLDAAPPADEPARRFQPVQPDAGGSSLRWRPVQPDEGVSDDDASSWSSGQADSPPDQSYATSRSTLGVSAVASRRGSDSFSASQSTLGISSTSGLFPDAEPEPAPAAHSDAALPLVQPSSDAAPVSHRTLWIVLGVAAAMMVIGVTALVIALTR